MKLYTSLTSPFGRKCRIVVQRAGLAARVEIVPTDNKSEAYRKINPLSKVPALERGDGSILIDSPVICAYLASVGESANTVMPADDEERWRALCLEALADGIMEAGILIFMENKREETLRSQQWMDVQATKINAGLDAIEAQADTFGARTDIGVLSVAVCALWLEFRKVSVDFRAHRPNLSAWLERFAAHDFMVSTQPPKDA